VPCDYGVISPRISSNNPFVVNFGPWIGLAKDLASARSFHDVWMFLFARPAGGRTPRADDGRTSGAGSRRMSNLP